MILTVTTFWIRKLMTGVTAQKMVFEKTGPMNGVMIILKSAHHFPVPIPKR
jgi:hypothetical protein